MRTTFRCCSILLVVAAVAILAASCTDDGADKGESEVLPSTDYWPTEGWRTSTPEKQGMDSATLVEMMQIVQEEGKNIDSITIIRNGHLVTDAFAFPYRNDFKHIIHSCTKSITSILVGIAIDKGYIESVDQPVTEFFPDKSFANLDDRKRAMTLKHLLTMASGLRCRDSYLYEWVGLAEMSASADWVQHVLDLPMSESPGTKFEYCNGVSYVLSAIIQDTTKMRTLDFANQHLFGPLGITDIRWSTSPQGVDIGWGGMWLRPHDMAKIGLLYINKGSWGGKQIVSESWVEASTPAHIQGTLFEQYGFQWWGDGFGDYFASGLGGQFIYVVPEKNMVVVSTGVLKDWGFFFPDLLLREYIIPAAASLVPLPENPEDHALLVSLLKKHANPNPADPVPSLPAMATKISGRTYRFDPNTAGIRALTLTFQPGSDEMQVEMSTGSEDSSVPLAIGLDNVYRVTRAGEDTWAGKGVWNASDELIVFYQQVGSTNRGKITIWFEGDRATMVIENIMDPPGLILTGHWTDSTTATPSGSRSH